MRLSQDAAKVSELGLGWFDRAVTMNVEQMDVVDDGLNGSSIIVGRAFPIANILLGEASLPQDVTVELDKARPENEAVAGRQFIVADTPNPAFRVNSCAVVPRWKLRNEQCWGLLYELLDHYLGLPQGHWPEKFHDFKQSRLNAAANEVQQAASAPATTGPSLPLDRYAGDYSDPWYGTINVRKTDSGLTITFPHSTGMSGPLTHHQYDTFKTNPSLKWIEPAYVTFSLDSDGKVDRVTMKPVSPAADFSFDYQDLLFSPAASR